MRHALIMGLSVLLATGLIAQEAPDRSLRPQLRAGSATAGDSAAPARAASTMPTTSMLTAAASASAVRTTSLRPASRPGSARSRAAAQKLTATLMQMPATTARDGTQRIRPRSRPKASRNGGLFARRKTLVCGNIDIEGEAIGRVPGRVRGCGVTDAVRVRSVSGVTLSPPAVMNCDTAQSLNTWINTGLMPAFRQLGKVAGLKVAAHHICRTRNNRPGARISEHGKGKAIDISAITLKNGKTYTVQQSWWRGRGKEPMRQAYQAACGPFGTTLGPNADRYHQDHFHFDTAHYRSGPYCK